MDTAFSILDKKNSPRQDVARPAYFLDLNLNQIIDKVTAQWGPAVKAFYYYFPQDQECGDYRRAVYGDVKQPEVLETLICFVEQAKEMENCRKQGAAVLSQLQKNVWQVREMEEYCSTFEKLLEGLEKAELKSEGMMEFRNLLGEYLKGADYGRMRSRVSELLAQLSAFRFRITYEKDRMILSQEETPGDYENFLDSFGDRERKPLRSPFQSNANLTDLERACLDVLMQKNPKLFQEIQKCAEDGRDYAKKELLRFLEEIPFYLSFAVFEKDMKGKGFSFAAPSVNQEEKMCATGLYDLALACVAVRENREVICNDMDYNKNESFFVLTGPNQGGKTTFARSLGQLVYFTRMGLDVPAVSANVHYFKNILTHFSVEESVETGRGKLKEELIRLAPMMAENCGDAFVVINELFTTAASYDAEIMGRKVLEHFIGQGCRGIYVTHLKELASVHPQIVSLRAMLNSERIQSFKIARSEAEESACARNQVNKYRLTYEQLKERL